ncbi:MAG: DMT family transporter [Thermomicrobiales bacterium]
MYVLLATLLWSSSGLFVKSGVFDDWPLADRGVLLAFWRALFAGLCLLPLVRRPRWRPSMLPMSLAFAAMNAAYLSALAMSTAANAIWLQSTAPLWVFAFHRFVMRQPSNRRDRWPLLLLLAGIGTIVWFEVQGQAVGGLVCGLLSGITYGGVVLGLRHLRDEDTAWLIALNHLVAAALMLPYVAYLDQWPTGNQLAVLAAFGVVQMGIPYVLFARGLRHINSQEATGIGLLEPLLMPLWVFLLAGESPAWWTLAGAACILAGLMLRYARGAQRPTLYQVGPEATLRPSPFAGNKTTLDEHE